MTLLCVTPINVLNFLIQLLFYAYMLVTFSYLGSDANEISEIKKLLCMKFNMKDVGHANVILGIKISRTGRGLSLSQSHC